MNWLDIVLIIWIIASAFSGFRLGFLYKATSLVATIFGLYFATKYTGTVAGWFGSGIWTIVVTFLMLISLVSHAAGLIAWGVNRAMSLAKWIPFVGLANRIAGACISVIVTGIIVSVMLWLVSTFSNGGDMGNVIAHSVIASTLLKCSLLFLPLVAHTLKDLVQP